MENEKNKKKKLKYFSTDKVYSVKSGKLFSPQVISYGLFGIAIVVLLLAVFMFYRSVNIGGGNAEVTYHEKGSADYKVYLKENKYYESKFLPSGMQYLASLISSINAKFDYSIKSNKDIDYRYSYDIVGDLQIVDSSDENKIIFSKQYQLLKPKTKTAKSDTLSISEDIDIDYDKYNSYVNAYKSEYGLSANSRLVVMMNVRVNGESSFADEKLNDSNKLQITIPLSQQTLDININSQKINKDGALKNHTGSIITSLPLFLVMISLFGIGVLLIIVSIRLHKEYVRENIYTITVKKILKEYDRLIVNGNVTIEEKTFDNKIHVDSFTELVDASQNLSSPILFYNVIPGEKCFFVIIKGNTLYKYRLTKAFLEREEEDKKNN